MNIPIINIPCSKSYAQRLIICACLAYKKGTVIIKNVSYNNDINACIIAMQALGAIIEMKHDSIIISKGINIVSSNRYNVNIGESGTTCRILIPILASLSCYFTIDGHGSILNRDMAQCKDILSDNPVFYELFHDRLPIQLFGRFEKTIYMVDGSASSQIISGTIIAYAYNKIPLRLIVNNCDSFGYVNITLDVLKLFGIDIKINCCNSTTIDIEMNGGQQMVCPDIMEVEGDWSSFGAIYLASSLLGDSIITDLNFESVQPDKDILQKGLDLFKNIAVNNNEIAINQIKEVTPFEVDISMTPDLFPYYAGFATLSNEYCKIKGLHKLTNKESDRGNVIFEEFINLGINCFIGDDTIYIKKGQIRDIEYNSHNDHRIGQTLAILKLVVDGSIKYNDSCINKSYQNFINDINKIYGKHIRTFI